MTDFDDNASVMTDVTDLNSTADTEYLEDTIYLHKKQQIYEWLERPSKKVDGWTNKMVVDKEGIIYKSKMRTSVPCLASVKKYKFKKSELDPLYNELLKHAIIDC